MTRPPQSSVRKRRSPFSRPRFDAAYVGGLRRKLGLLRPEPDDDRSRRTTF